MSTYAFLKRQPHIRKPSRHLHIIREEDDRSPSRTPSPPSSPDPFHLTFTDTSFQFPHPPVSTPSPSRLGSLSPTPSMSTSDTSTSPDSLSSDLPTTPSSSDDECPSYYSSAWPSFNARRASIRPLSITKRNLHDSPQSEDDDDESDSEWYTREFSKILTMKSPLPPSTTHAPKPRPDSIYIPSTSRSTILAFPSSHLDPAFPRSTPPPVPPKPKSRKSHLSLRRPPPRSSIPADCVFLDSSPDASYYAFSDDSVSAFSFSLYDSLPTPTPTSPASAYSQSSSSPNPSPYPPSFPSSATSDEFEFDLDLELDDLDIQFACDANTNIDIDGTLLTLPSLPTSPIDLEADIAHGLEELRLRPPPPPPSPSHVPAPTSTCTPPRPHNAPDRVLRSKWSASTLNSIREDQPRRTPSSKLRAYFSTSLPSPTPKSKPRSSTSSHKTPSSPSPSPSPSRSRFKQRRELYAYAHPPRANPNATRGAEAGADVVIMGYGREGVQVKRRGSTGSETGSEDGSACGAGLRRKPIPVEMFLRSAV